MVGHSQGGMMPRYYIKFLGGAKVVDDLVGLSPSNHGTTIVGDPGNPLTGALRRACPACDQQAAGSPFLTRLNAGDETPGTVSYTQVTTRYDEVVVPYTSAYLAAGPAHHQRHHPGPVPRRPRRARADPDEPHRDRGHAQRARPPRRRPTRRSGPPASEQPVRQRPREGGRDRQPRHQGRLDGVVDVRLAGPGAGRRPVRGVELVVPRPALAVDEVLLGVRPPVLVADRVRRVAGDLGAASRRRRAPRSTTQCIRSRTTGAPSQSTV